MRDELGAGAGALAAGAPMATRQSRLSWVGISLQQCIGIPCNVGPECVAAAVEVARAAEDPVADPVAAEALPEPDAEAAVVVPLAARSRSALAIGPLIRSCVSAHRNPAIEEEARPKPKPRALKLPSVNAARPMPRHTSTMLDAVRYEHGSRRRRKPNPSTKAGIVPLMIVWNETDTKMSDQLEKPMSRAVQTPMGRTTRTSVARCNGGWRNRGSLVSSHAARATIALLHAVMKNGKWKWLPESSCLFAKMISIDELYQITMHSVTGTQAPARATSLAAEAICDHRSTCLYKQCRIHGRSADRLAAREDTR